MNVDDVTNPYQIFIDVLSFRYSTAHLKALTGEMISAYAEMNHMLGRSKGHIARKVWAALADELARCVHLYETAWADANPHLMGDPAAPPHPGGDLTAKFQAAAEGLRAAVERMRHEFALIGMTSWVYDLTRATPEDRL